MFRTNTYAKYFLCQFFDGKQALGILSNTNKIDLVLMDIQLSGSSGLEATKLILEINPNIPIIAQSAYAMN